MYEIVVFYIHAQTKILFFTWIIVDTITLVSDVQHSGLMSLRVIVCVRVLSDKSLNDNFKMFFKNVI